MNAWNALDQIGMNEIEGKRKFHIENLNWLFFFWKVWIKCESWLIQKFGEKYGTDWSGILKSKYYVNLWNFIEANINLNFC